MICVTATKKCLSRCEFDNVCRAVVGWAKLVYDAAKDKDTLALLQWLDESQQADKLFENQQLLRQPIAVSYTHLPILCGSLS